jgi:hypothetical protein
MKVARKYIWKMTSSLRKVSSAMGMISVSALILVVAACSKSTAPENQNPEGGNEVEPSGFPVSLAFGMKDVNYSPATKTLSSVAQADGSPSSFRGMSDIYFLPFDVQREVRPNDHRLGDYLTLPYAGIDKTFENDGSSGTFRGLVKSNNSHYYKYIYVPAGTASFLVYGKADEDNPVSIGGTTYTKGTQEYKHLYGSLIPEDAGSKASDITFSPEPIIADAATKTTIVAKAQKIADMLNSLLNISNSNYTSSNYSVRVYYYRNWWGWQQYNHTFSWDADYGNSALQSLRNQLLSVGMFAASGPSMTVILQNLYRGLANTGSDQASLVINGTERDIYMSDDEYDPYSYSDLYLTTIGERIEEFATVSGSGAGATLTLKDADLRGFPGNMGLPEGCVAIQWDGSKFVVISEGTYDIHLAPMDRFCYPPSLWYYVNSQVSVAKMLGSEASESVAESNIAAWYKNTSAAWSNILDQYNAGERRLGPVVKKGAVSVAINDPMQYGVALLKLNLSKTTSATLVDRDGINVNVNNSNFPMTAVIVAGQHKQSFDFSPLTGNEYYVYDNMPLSDAGATLSWLTNSGSVTNSPSHTLLLQSLQADDVKICIEFQNNSNTTFRGATGYIVPGSKFYMYGEIVYNNGSGDKAKVKSVFQQDYITEVTLAVNSLKNAYNCIPDLQDPQLEVGVEISVDWILATPTNVPLY